MPAYKYTLKDGKTVLWYAKFYYTDWTGTKKQICKRGFKTQREAKEYERTFIDRGRRTSDILFPNFIEEYLNDMSHRAKPTTMSGKRYMIGKHIMPYFEKLRVRDIDPKTVRSWQNELISYRDENGKPYSKTYLKSMHIQLSAIMNYAVSHYGLPVNPCKAAGSIGKSKSKEMKIWTQEQYEQFSACVNHQIMKIAFDILFYSGLRSGEMLALTPADILPDMRIDVNKTYTRAEGKDVFMDPKTEKSRRKVSIPEFLYNEINEFTEKLQLNENERIFYFAKNALRNHMKSATEKAELPPIRVHDLRHSHASMLIEMGVDIKQISERLGHESVKTTWDTYAHLYPDKDTKLAEELNKLRRPET